VSLLTSFNPYRIQITRLCQYESLSHKFPAIKSLGVLSQLDHALDFIEF
jgi:hypothetical protein